MVKVTDQLIVEKKDGVGRITFDNQAKRNALTYEMWQGLPVVLDDFASDSAVRVIVLSGAGGKAFSAGADISQFEKQRSSEDTIAVYDEAVAKATNALVGARKPLIARIDGFCIGGGLGVAMCCDLRIAGAARFFNGGHRWAYLGGGSCRARPSCGSPSGSGSPYPSTRACGPASWRSRRDRT